MFDRTNYQIRQRFAIGNKYTIYEGDDEEPILESAQKKLRLKEDFRFTDPQTGDELFRVRADSMLDVAAAYDIVDSRTDERVGSVQRSVKSFLKHEYTLHGPDGEQVATVAEDSWVNAFLRRNITTLVPFAYTIDAPDGSHLGDITGQFSLRDRYDITLTGDDRLDPRLAVVSAVVIDAIEGN